MKKLDLEIAYYQIIREDDRLPRRYNTKSEAEEIVQAAAWDPATVRIVGYNKFDKVIERGWFWPTGARKAHFDRGDGYALCGKWSRFSFSGREVPMSDPEGSPASKDDCVVCRRKLEAGQ